MGDEYRVKGSSINSKFEFVRERLGGAAEGRLIDRLRDFENHFPILDSAWYPFTIYDQINRAIAELFFDGDLERLKEVGMFSAESVLNSVYKSFAQGKDYVGFLRRAAILHGRFYDAGKMEVILGDDGRSAEVVHTDAPVYSEADLHVASGFYIGAGRSLGLDDVRSEFRMTPTGVRFRLRWT